MLSNVGTILGNKTNRTAFKPFFLAYISPRLHSNGMSAGMYRRIPCPLSEASLHTQQFGMVPEEQQKIKIKAQP